MKEMLLSGLAGDENVIQVDENKTILAEKAIHEPLKSLGYICQAERHGHILEKSERCNFSRLRDVCLSYRDLVIAFD